MEKVIKILGVDYDSLKTHLFRANCDDEEAAILLAGVSWSNTRLTLLVREVIPVPDEALLKKSPVGLTISSDFLATLIKRCRTEHWGFLLAHSHPFATDHVGFSSIDDTGELALMPKVQARAPRIPHGTVVFGRNAVSARLWLPGSKRSTVVDALHVVRGEYIKLPANPVGRTPPIQINDAHDRQVRALGPQGQQRLQAMRVAVVGTGGVGSQVFQQLTHLGVGSIVPVDHDRIERSNLSRVVGSTLDDVGRRKVDTSRRLGLAINPNLEGEPIYGSVLNMDVALALRDVDVIFCCTDNLRSRMTLNRLARQYLIPLIDMGIDIQPELSEPGVIRRIGGRVMVIYPDDPCLACLGVLIPEAIEAESGGRGQGYVQGQDVPAPSVISLNGVVASLAVTEFLNLVTGFARREHRTYSVYDGVRGQVRSVALQAYSDCTICIELRATGDKVTLPAKYAAG